MLLPYIIEMKFEGNRLLGISELSYVDKSKVISQVDFQDKRGI